MNKLEKQIITLLNSTLGRKLVIEDERSLDDQTNSKQGHTIYDLSSLDDYMMDNQLHTSFKGKISPSNKTHHAWNTSLSYDSCREAARQVLVKKSNETREGKINLYVFEGNSTSKVYIDLVNTIKSTNLEDKPYTVMNNGRIHFTIKNEDKNCGVFNENGWYRVH